MKKVKYKLLLLIFIFIPINGYALELPEVNSKNVIVYDLTSDTLIAEKNSQEPVKIASLTKIMTVITAIENIEDLDKMIMIEPYMLENIYWNASVAGLSNYDQVTYRDLLYAAILPSGADATNVLAYSICGNVSSFVNKMNELAAKIGMQNTHFINTTGLDEEGEYSTAEDVLIMLKYALNNETFKEVYTTKEFTLSNGLKVTSTLKSYQERTKLDLFRIIGSKTGNTDQAGLCMSALFLYDNHEILIITLNAERVGNNFYHLIDTQNIMAYIDYHYEIPKQEIIIPVTKINEQITKISSYHLEVTIGIGISFLVIFICFIKKRKKKKKRTFKK